MELAEKHERRYLAVGGADRLACLDTTPKAFKYLCNNLEERLRRESAIPEEDVEAMVIQIIDYPFLGGRKGTLKLLEDRKGSIGETFYKESKRLLLELAEKKLAVKKLESELEKNKYKRIKKKADSFKKITTTECHQVWAIDFTYITMFGIQFFICVVYELHSQGYLSIVACDSPSKEIAMLAVVEAIWYSRSKPKRFILSDCGGQFLSFAYQELLDNFKIKDLQTPPGQPWYNGALESGNRDLKYAILTIAMYEASIHPDISKVGTSRKKILDFLKSCCLKARKMINEKIPRVKFGTTPMAVLKNEVAGRKKQRDLFAKEKAEERKQRMQKIKQGEIRSKHKTLEDKVKAVWGKISKTMTIEKLFAFTELLNKRYQAVTN